VPGEKSMVLTSPDGALVRIAATELNPTASARVQALEGGIDLGTHATLRQLPPLPSGIVCLVGRGARICARFELRRSYTNAEIGDICKSSGAPQMSDTTWRA